MVEDLGCFIRYREELYTTLVILRRAYGSWGGSLADGLLAVRELRIKVLLSGGRGGGGWGLSFGVGVER